MNNISYLCREKNWGNLKLWMQLKQVTLKWQEEMKKKLHNCQSTCSCSSEVLKVGGVGVEKLTEGLVSWCMHGFSVYISFTARLQFSCFLIFPRNNNKRKSEKTKLLQYISVRMVKSVMRREFSMGGSRDMREECWSVVSAAVILQRITIMLASNCS